MSTRAKKRSNQNFFSALFSEWICWIFFTFVRKPMHFSWFSIYVTKTHLLCIFLIYSRRSRPALVHLKIRFSYLFGRPRNVPDTIPLISRSHSLARRPWMHVKNSETYAFSITRHQKCTGYRKRNCTGPLAYSSICTWDFIMANYFNKIHCSEVGFYPGGQNNVRVGSGNNSSGRVFGFSGTRAPSSM